MNAKSLCESIHPTYIPVLMSSDGYVCRMQSGKKPGTFVCIHLALYVRTSCTLGMHSYVLCAGMLASKSHFCMSCCVPHLPRIPASVTATACMCISPARCPASRLQKWYRSRPKVVQLALENGITPSHCDTLGVLDLCNMCESGTSR